MGNAEELRVSLAEALRTAREMNQGAIPNLTTVRVQADLICQMFELASEYHADVMSILNPGEIPDAIVDAEIANII